MRRIVQKPVQDDEYVNAMNWSELYGGATSFEHIKSRAITLVFKQHEIFPLLY